VVDLDALALEASFAPSLADFGFYLSVDAPSGPLLSYSQAALNRGADTFASFRFLPNPLFGLVAFQVGGQLYSLGVVDGALRGGGGLGWTAARRRSTRSG
jgi:hypothetical protein